MPHRRSGEPVGAVPTGDLDATLVVYRRVRSQLEPVNCEVSDRRGRAGFQFRPVRNGIYLIRVGQRAGSVAGRYQLEAFAPPSPPGPALRPNGVIRTLDPLQDTSDAWSVRLGRRLRRLGLAYRSAHELGHRRARHRQPAAAAEA
jgi:hypothetical protein